ncbi:hypothetical protein CB0940_06523 [Cercospora beticola]|uniref:Uncharacterized protein n=1 Tax=Cercospora beticola TaxID=122368 RepID=A0A2G5HYZ7_CERBT|nr:hypothetical protein CB0940_06523 [Cercospora beticola]PIA97756.1 hypothetical protein CB0940_06523 [Cercospora beticola]WPA99161.1 hypothetical protein RHO25_003777 [Cercospora beticola]CAK1360475.1 unnamed protein product [Cercospora beticola]
MSNFNLKTHPERPQELLLTLDTTGAGREATDPVTDPQTIAESRVAEEYRHSPVSITINDPTALKMLGEKMSHDGGDGSIALSTDREERVLRLASIAILEVGILAPITLEDELTPEELNGGTDGPVLSSLIKSWREAFRSLPEKHAIQRVRFNMRCQQNHEPRHIVRLLQEVSTGMYMKAKRAMGRQLVFEATGCEDDAKKRWLEASLPAVKKK